MKNELSSASIAFTRSSEKIFTFLLRTVAFNLIQFSSLYHSISFFCVSELCDPEGLSHVVAWISFFTSLPLSEKSSRFYRKSSDSVKSRWLPANISRNLKRKRKKQSWGERAYFRALSISLLTLQLCTEMKLLSKAAGGSSQKMTTPYFPGLQSREFRKHFR